jgi:hypothetical protein
MNRLYLICKDGRDRAAEFPLFMEWDPKGIVYQLNRSELGRAYRTLRRGGMSRYSARLMIYNLVSLGRRAELGADSGYVRTK